MSGEEGAFHSSVERELDFDTNPQVGIAVLTLPCPRTDPTMQHISGFPNIGASTFPPARWDEHRHQVENSGMYGPPHERMAVHAHLVLPLRNELGRNVSSLRRGSMACVFCVLAVCGQSGESTCISHLRPQR